MKRIAFTTLALIATPALATPAFAAPHLHSFRALEFQHDGQQRMAVARESLAHHIPAGTPVADARATLEIAGARCEAGATLTCRHASAEAIENMHRSVHWTVDVAHEGGAVTGMTVDRESIGS